jgi:hypothetical protein
MAPASRLHKALLLLGALACVAGAGAWWLWPRHLEFYTDADAIRLSPEDARLRDILWRPPEPLADTLNSPADEAEPRISADGSTLYLTRPTPGAGIDVLVAERSGDGWGPPRPVHAINSPDNELSATPSPDGGWVYFSSDRPGGLGGLDVWRVERSADGWGQPERLGPEVNSAADDAWPALSHDATRLYFASNRPTEDAEPPGAHDAPGFDLFVAALDGTIPSAAERLDELASPGDELAPACSPAGDFLYFASDRDEGRGGFDLYRARVMDGHLSPAEPLGAEVNTDANELDPTLSMGGFRLLFSSDRASPEQDERGYDVFETTSREVYLGAETRSGTLADLLRLLPWILAALALVLLLSLLGRSAGSEVWRVRWGTLSLMAKCLLVSLVLHAGLLALLSLWDVRSNPALPAADERAGVSLTSSALASAVRSQLRSDPIAAAPPTAESPTTPAPDADVTPLPPSESPRAPAPTPSAWRDAPLGAPASPLTAAGPSSPGPGMRRRTPAATALQRRSPVEIATPAGASPEPVAEASAPPTLAPSSPELDTAPSPPSLRGRPDRPIAPAPDRGSAVEDDNAPIVPRAQLADASPAPVPASTPQRRVAPPAPERTALRLALPAAPADAPAPGREPATDVIGTIAATDADAPRQATLAPALDPAGPSASTIRSDLPDAALALELPPDAAGLETPTRAFELAPPTRGAHALRPAARSGRRGAPAPRHGGSSSRPSRASRSAAPWSASTLEGDRRDRRGHRRAAGEFALAPAERARPRRGPPRPSAASSRAPST